MTEEPEDVLEHHGVATGSRVKEGGAEMTVGQGHGDSTRQDRHHSNQQISGDEPCPNEHGHLHQGHARGAHVQDGDDDVDGTHDG